jgi:hypothetical protein
MAYGINAPFGLKPLCSINGGAWTEKYNTYRISATADGTATYATNIFTGDPVIWNTAAGGDPAYGAGTIARYTPNIEQAADDGAVNSNATPVLGVFMGCEYTLATGELVKSAYWPGNVVVMAGSKIKALVIDDPNVLFEIQASSSQNILNNARFSPDLTGQNFGFGLGGGGNTLVPNNPGDGVTRTGQSAFYLDIIQGNSDHTAAYLPLKAIGYAQNPQNLSNTISYTANTTSPFLNIVVMINNHVYKAGTAGIVAA